MSEMPDLSVYDDRALVTLAALVAQEQHARAVATGDPATLAQAALASAFDRKGQPVTPWIDGGLLFCPGSIEPRGTGHECVFVAVDDSWCWEHPQNVADHVVRDDGRMRSVTVLVAVEGLAVTQVESKARSGRHERQRSRSWAVSSGQLEPVTRAVSAPTSHR
jgi:hypothetical protein